MRKRKRGRRRNFLEVAALFVGFGSGIFVLLALCSLLTLAGLSCQATLSVWTSITVFFALVIDNGSGIFKAGFAGSFSRCVLSGRCQAPDASHHGRYGPEGL